jgi:predicted XRE-type DNA-binding protein
MFSSGKSVFFDICDTPEEAYNLTLRSELMVQIEQLIRRRNLTQGRAAKLFGVTQPRISDLIRGKIDLFSLESLINMLTRAGIAVHLVVEQSAA